MRALSETELAAQLPVVIVADRFVHGGAEYSDRCRVIRLDQALKARWPDWAHVATYYQRGLDPGLQHRVNKSDREAVDKCNCAFVMVDVDRSPHDVPWENPQAAVEALAAASAAAAQEIGAPPSFAYTTVKGLRLGWLYRHELSTVEQEAALSEIVARLYRPMADLGLRADTSAEGWNRLFALPIVTPDSGVPTDTHGTVFQVQNWASRIDGRSFASSAKMVRRSGPSKAARGYEGDCPSPHDALAIAVTASGLRTPAAENLYRAAVDAIRAQVFDRPDVPVTGERNRTLTRISGGLCYAAQKAPGATPELVLGAMVPMLTQMPSDRTLEEECEIVWDMICRFWDGAPEPDEDAQAEFREGVRRSFPNLKNATDEQVDEWAEQNVVVTVGKHTYMLTPKGRYDHRATTWSTALHVVSRDPVLRRYAGRLYTMTNDGGSMLKVQDTFRSMHEAAVVDAVATCRPWNFDYQNQTTLPLLVHQVDEHLEPAADLKVAIWLQALAGPDWPSFEKYLAAMPNAALPLVALWVWGLKGAGKDLLHASMARVFGRHKPSTQLTINGFQGHLLQSPLVVFNESVQMDRTTGSGVSHQIRDAVGHYGKQINVKYGGMISAELCLRLAFFSNKPSMLIDLMQQEDTSVEDRSAVAERFLVLHAKMPAVEAVHDLVQSHRGRVGTLPERVARHILWIATERSSILEDGEHRRFTVEANEMARALFEQQGRVTQRVLAILEGLMRELDKVDRIVKQQRTSKAPAIPGVEAGWFIGVKSAVDASVRGSIERETGGKVARYSWLQDELVDDMVRYARSRGDQRNRVMQVDLFRLLEAVSSLTRLDPPTSEILSSVQWADPDRYDELAKSNPDFFEILN